MKKTDKTQFNSSVESLKKTKMLENDRNDMESSIFSALDTRIPVIPGFIPSPYQHSVFERTKKPLILGLSGIVIFSGSLAFAANGALPGDTLYKIKTKVTEPLVLLFKHDPTERAEYQLGLANKRAAEIKILKDRNTLTVEQSKEANEIMMNNINAAWDDSENITTGAKGSIQIDIQRVKSDLINSTNNGIDSSSSLKATSTISSSNMNNGSSSIDLKQDLKVNSSGNRLIDANGTTPHNSSASSSPISKPDLSFPSKNTPDLN
ncbi:MAG: hypothetical protein JWN37_652 [Candidatus Nomurabacteria bacterium]|nr:hypothetical protein [Candidatus Nomurabacteria bacterium]